MGDFEAKDHLRQVLAADRLIDDPFGNVQRNIDKRHGQGRQQQQKQLAAEGMSQDITIDRLVYPGIIGIIPLN